jgi:hypothetical protein
LAPAGAQPHLWCCPPRAPIPERRSAHRKPRNLAKTILLATPPNCARPVAVGMEAAPPRDGQPPAVVAGRPRAGGQLDLRAGHPASLDWNWRPDQENRRRPGLRRRPPGRHRAGVARQGGPPLRRGRRRPRPGLVSRSLVVQAKNAGSPTTTAAFRTQGATATIRSLRPPRGWLRDPAGGRRGPGARQAQPPPRVSSAPARPARP